MQAQDILRTFLSPAEAPASLRQSIDRRFWISAFLAWAVSVAIRMMELKGFLTPAFLIDGERMLATHDGYAFLAGAQGTSSFASEALSGLMALLTGLTGIALGDLGFWLPPLFAGLAALPVCLTAARAGRPEAGAAAGIMAASCYAYFIRSRIGFLDTDILTLFFAYGTAAGLYLWLVPQCRTGWLPSQDRDDAGRQPLHLALAGAVALGLFLLCYLRFYSSGRPLALAMLGGMAVLGLLLARRGNRTGMLLGLAAILAGMQYGPIALVVALALAALAWKRPEAVRAHQLGALVGGVALVIIALQLLLPSIEQYYDLLLVYINTSGRELSGDVVREGLKLPSVMSSVREAARPNPLDVLWLMSGKMWLFWFALGGYALAVVRRPLLLAYLPLFCLGIASIKLGTRFAMYGGGAVGLGLGLLAADLTALATQRRVVRYAVQGALAALCAVLLALPLGSIVPQRVLSNSFAATLKELDGIAAKNAKIWQWWDYGYAAQYYAKRESFADGGRHSGDWIYPLALAHATSSVAQASNIIAFTGADIEEQVRLAEASGKRPASSAVLEFNGVDPVRKLADLGGERAMEVVDGMTSARPELAVAPPEQYFVVAWENLRYLATVSALGSWNLQTGASWGGRSSSVAGAAVDFQRGLMRAPGGQMAKLSGMTVVDKDGAVRKVDWMNFGAPYAVGNMQNGEMYVMDAQVYKSMMVRMLLDDPREFEPHFTLVVDKGPFCRAYRVN